MEIGRHLIAEGFYTITLLEKTALFHPSVPLDTCDFICIPQPVILLKLYPVMCYAIRIIPVPVRRV